MTHELKIAPKYFDDVKNEVKTFEVRLNDRDFKAGDKLILKKWLPGVGYTGDEIERYIIYIFPGGVFGIDKDYCVLGMGHTECTSTHFCPHRRLKR